mmetsp:Transcript_20562/g.55393  ORF Transcript_20562/g.55393 Transcript_20562/m.55393 type:complete len:107 (+) Transcript_20562:103-423(+)
MAAQMYVRIKRKNQTLFIYVEPNETVDALKQKIERIMKVSAADMRLYPELESTAHPMSDKETLEKLSIQPEQELALVFKKPGSDDFEDIKIITDAAGLTEEAEGDA